MSDSIKDVHVSGQMWQVPAGTDVRIYLIGGHELAGKVAKVHARYIDLGSAAEGEPVIRVAVSAIAAIRGVDPDYKPKPKPGSISVW